MSTRLQWSRTPHRAVLRHGAGDASPAGKARRRRHGRIAEGTFVAHPLLRNPHLQTVLPDLLRRPPLELRRERVELPDGDFVTVGWSGEDNVGGPVAILVPGIAGGFRSQYVLGMARVLNERGWITACLQLRGAGGEPNRLARVYHHGDTDDFHYVCALLRERFAPAPLAAIGWSLGANIVLKGLGEHAGDSVIDVACAVSPPFRLEAVAQHLRSGAARIYQAMMLMHMKRLVREKYQKAKVPLPQGADLERALRATDFFDLGDAFTAPMTGFRDCIEYCRAMECARYLHAVRRPTLVIHALDDPFMPSDIIPSAQELAPQVRLELTAQGGHVGFVGSGEWGQPVFWLEQRIPEFLDRALQHVPVVRRAAPLAPPQAIAV